MIGYLSANETKRTLGPLGSVVDVKADSSVFLDWSGPQAKGARMECS